MNKISIATCLWRPNFKSFGFSKCYDETWVNKLYRACRRNLSVDFDFYCFTDEDEYEFEHEEIIHRPALEENPGYDAYIEPFQIEGPLIVIGLDTIIVGNIDYLADLAQNYDKLYLPKDPYFDRACNGIAIRGPGLAEIYDKHAGQNDMDWLNMFDYELIDDLYPDSVVSFKQRVRQRNWSDSFSIVYFHGNPKMNQSIVSELDWVKRHWV